MQPRRGSSSICLDFGSREHYDAFVGDASLYRGYVEEQYRQHPELFPEGMGSGFVLHSSRASMKLGIVLRRIQVKASKATFWIRPSLAMPYMVAFTDDVERGLFMLHHGASLEALEYAFGHDHMFWYVSNRGTPPGLNLIPAHPWSARN